MFNFVNGKEIANIYKKNGEDGEKFITKLKAEQSYHTSDEKLNQPKTSNKDANLIIENNSFNLPDGYAMRLSPGHDIDQNFRIVVLAPSGSGKTTWVKNFIMDYRKRWPKKDVFLFSENDSDKSIDSAKPIRIKITEAEVAQSIKSRTPLFENKNLAKSLVIFDDTYSAHSKLLVDFWDSLAADLAQNARKLEVDLIFVLHNSNYSRTRFIFSEATHMVLFLRAGGKAMYGRILEQYQGFKDPKIRKKLFNLPSRYVIFSNLAPTFILTETQALTYEHFEE